MSGDCRALRKLYQSHLRDLLVTAVGCGPLCGQGDWTARWDKPERRVAASSGWAGEGFELLRSQSLDEVVETHLLAASHGRTTGTGVTKPHFLDSIWAEYQRNIEDRIDPVYTATRLVKHVVMHRPFADANRRTSFLWSATHFAAFGHRIVIDTPEAVRFKESAKQARFEQVYTWFEKQVR